VTAEVSPDQPMEAIVTNWWTGAFEMVTARVPAPGKSRGQ
jgi:hypothetical protein